jgi:XTP/dITP diphosphohydrolase
VTPTLLIATTNAGKLREAWAILDGLDVRLVALKERPDLPVPTEDGNSFEENAELKALHYARLSGCPALADDSGLEVDVLDGAPGVQSARYAGPACDAAANNAKLIRELAGVPEAKRAARFRCVVALADPEGVLATASGMVEGVIIDHARGANGFGYDPHFLVPERGLTTAEMSPEQKNSISHRGKALRAIRPAIERLLADLEGMTPGE